MESGTGGEDSGERAQRSNFGRLVGEQDIPEKIACFGMTIGLICRLLPYLLLSTSCTRWRGRQQATVAPAEAAGTSS